MPNGIHTIPREQATGIAVRSRKGLVQAPDAENPLVWIDVSNPGPDEAAFLRDELGFHPLAVEDCIRGRQRPKLDRYPNYFFMVVYAASVNPGRNRMALNELHIFLGTGFVVTVHDYKIGEVKEVVARWRAAPEQVSGTGTLAHILLDLVVDDYFKVVEHFADRTDEFESGSFMPGQTPDMQQILVTRHELVLFRKVVAPLRDVLSTLLRRDLPFLIPALVPYFQDVHDHTIRVTEEIDSLRELLSALLDAQISLSANQLNHTLRTMTAWSIILMSIAAIAGVYGMNFVHMPELQWRWGYFFALGLMATVGVGLASFFKHRNWL
ncbi:MAG: magnesium/cobalt transporter CorA [Gemmatimonadetes bacterium]|nr:magnesium/cobalt transporter CorA [Gemmatimonadota bacterium]